MSRLARLLLPLLTLSCVSQPATHGIAYTGGEWWDGDHFVAKTMYVVGDTLRDRPPTVIDRKVDLHGKFVVPPLAEAHNHWLEPDRIEAYVDEYLHDGVFYVMDESYVPFIAEQVRAKTNRPASVDYRVAILGFTGPGGHPIQIVKQFAAMGEMPKEWNNEEAIDGNALLIVTTDRDVDERWPLLRAAHPDFVKVFLEYSDDRAQRPYLHGIDPKLVRHIVQRAHADGLRVSAHVYSAADFRSALAAGVDLIAHMPGTGAGEESDLQRFLITDDDAERAARSHTPVITTLSWLDDLRDENAERAALVERVVIRPNIEKLRRHAVQLLIGSDQFRKTPVGELFILSRLGFANREILRIAWTDTPRAIFPGRNIGELRDGDEASFLVLSGNPVEDLQSIRSVESRVKQGVTIATPRSDRSLP